MEVTVQKTSNSPDPVRNSRPLTGRISLSRGSVLSREYFPSSCQCVRLFVCLSEFFLPQILSTGVRVYDRPDTADWYVINVAAIASVLRILEKLISVLLKQ